MQSGQTPLHWPSCAGHLVALSSSIGLDLAPPYPLPRALIDIGLTPLRPFALIICFLKDGPLLVSKIVYFDLHLISTTLADCELPVGSVQLRIIHSQGGRPPESL